MKKYLSYIIISAFFFVFVTKTVSQIQLQPITGYIKDATIAEALPGASIFDTNSLKGTTSDENGYFELNLLPGKYEFRISFVGYQTIKKTIIVPHKRLYNIFLQPSSTTLQTVSIRADRPDQNVTSTQMGMQKLDKVVVKEIASFLGETDAIKVLQLLPGIQATSEGSSGFSVRGGAPDQNLILLDDVPVFSASHLLGFFSVFNNDVVEDLTIYKGDIPAKFGGRLSSLLDIRTINGKLGRIEGKGGIGTISSRLMLEGGITPKTSFMIGGRRTYADLALKFSKDEAIKDSRLYFYDLNLKLSHTINENNRVFINGYSGDDFLLNSDAGVIFGNTLGSINWYHNFNNKLRSDFTIYSSEYRYKFQLPEGSPAAFEWTSGIIDFGGRYDFIYNANDKTRVKFGASSIYHQFEPGTFQGIGDSSFFGKIMIDETRAFEHGIYGSIETELTPRLKIRTGLRISMYQSVGPGTVYNFDESYSKTDSSVYAKGNIFNTYWAPEPRIGVTYLLNKSMSVKASYARNVQYMQLAQNSTSGTPIDFWFSASPNIKPQTSDQLAFGLFKNLFDNSLELSLEGFHKWYHNAIDFKDHAELFLNPYLDGEVRVGEGRSYGLEFLARFNRDKYYGWVAYTLSRAERTIPGINNGETYLAPFDKTHDISVVFNYKILPRLTASFNWVYYTGNPITFPTGRFEYGGVIAPVYSDRNSYRMPDYHRMDLGLTYKFKGKPSRRWKSEINISVYNLYNRHNAWTINFMQEEDNPKELYAEKTYLFPVLPAITYNFNF